MKTFNFKPDLFVFLGQESPKEIRALIGYSILLGLTNTALIAIINQAAKTVTNHESVTWPFILYAILMILFLLFARRSNRENIEKSRDVIYRFKIKILKDIFNSNLSRVDEIGRFYISEVLIRDTQQVAQSIVVVVTACQSVATLIFLSLYLATVSISAFFIIMCASAIIVVVGATELYKVTSELNKEAAKEGHVNSLYADYLNGFKEIKMNSARAYDITSDLITETKALNESTTDIIVRVTNFFNYLQVLMYVVVGVIIFVVPVFSSEFSTSVTTATTTALFLAGTLAGIITSIPNISQSSVSAKNLLDLVEALKIGANDRSENQSDIVKTSFKTIELKDVTYRYVSDAYATKFNIGPANFTFEAGKLYFIKGSNGSGKTTLMRILIGLYSPLSGAIWVDGNQVEPTPDSTYRDLFSVVFSDFFLFKKLYGIKNQSVETLDSLLKMFDLDRKIKIEQNTFSDLNLSTGQRKRVALMVALLENRQVLILDEWAADQDPEFRKEFYTEILPLIKSMNKMVIAITHDDRYFGIADSVLEMKNGQLLKVS